MKNIAIWKIILLTFVTFGLYSIYWFARNRKYLVATTESKIPGWTWLLAIPVIYGMSSIIGFAYLIGAVFGHGEVSASVTAYHVAVITGTVVAALIYVWWLWQFGTAIQSLLQGRLPVWLIAVLGVVTGPFVIAFIQFYINRLDQNKKGEKYTVSKGLKVITIILAVLAAISLVATIATFESNNSEIEREITKTRNGFVTIQELSKKYTTCTTSLATDFPGDLTDETKPKYLAASEACDKIQAEYQESINRYIKGEL